MRSDATSIDDGTPRPRDSMRDGVARDCWIDVETGEWGLVSNLVLIHQIDLPAAISAEATPELSDKARTALIRCAGIDLGQPIGREERFRNT